MTLNNFSVDHSSEAIKTFKWHVVTLQSSILCRLSKISIHRFDRFESSNLNDRSYRVCQMFPICLYKKKLRSDRYIQSGLDMY